MPLVPPFKLAALLSEGTMHPKITPAIRSPMREVRAAALNSLGSLASRAGALSAFASSTPYADIVFEWVGAMGDALLDPSHAVTAAAHACAR